MCSVSVEYVVAAIPIQVVIAVAAIGGVGPGRAVVHIIGAVAGIWHGKRLSKSEGQRMRSVATIGVVVLTTNSSTFE